MPKTTDVSHLNGHVMRQLSGDGEIQCIRVWSLEGSIHTPADTEISHRKSIWEANGRLGSEKWVSSGVDERPRICWAAWDVVYSGSERPARQRNPARR